MLLFNITTTALTNNNNNRSSICNNKNSFVLRFYFRLTRTTRKLSLFISLLKPLISLSIPLSLCPPLRVFNSGFKCEIQRGTHLLHKYTRTPPHTYNKHQRPHTPALVTHSHTSVQIFLANLKLFNTDERNKTKPNQITNKQIYPYTH